MTQAFEFIEKNISLFEFNLFYVIVSGRLAEEFFNLDIEKVMELNILDGNNNFLFK